MWVHITALINKTNSANQPANLPAKCIGSDWVLYKFCQSEVTHTPIYRFIILSVLIFSVCG